MKAAAYLESLVHFGQRLGLETTRALCDALGRPERAYPTLLVAGTNGKGSVAAYLDSALRECGRRVGRYTSPHLVRVHERITVDGAEIGDEALDETLAQVRGVASTPTYFEALTVAAFLHFRAAAVDVAVLEVGMGGRLDATNVSDPLVSAVVSIDFDHEAYLGRTLAAIAGEKAGVLRAGRATVVGPLPEEARGAIDAVAAGLGARVVPADAGARWDEDAAGLRLSTARGVYAPLRPLAGAHQRDNLLVAVRVLEEAREAGLAIDLGCVAAGISRAEWPGRLQWLPGDPPLLVDGAHNVAGARALAAYVAENREGALRDFVLLFGALRDKAYAEMARILFPLAREVVATEPPEGRAAAVADIRAAAEGLAVPIHTEADVSRALALARARARGRGPVVVAGSLYLVGAVLGRRGLRAT
jgi:dihydrofolate synthase/folylpolyglutamate synthase